MHPAICVPEKHNIDIRIVDGEKAMDGILVPLNPGSLGSNIGVRRLKECLKPIRYVFTKIHIDAPPGKIATNQSKILIQTVVIAAGNTLHSILYDAFVVFNSSICCGNRTK